MPYVPIEDAHIAVYNALKTHFAARDPVIPVYDEVPAGTAPPYIFFDAQRWRGNHTKTSKGWEGFIEVQVASTYRGRKEVTSILDEVLEEADGISFSGWTTIHRDDTEVSVERVTFGDKHGFLGTAQLAFQASKS